MSWQSISDLVARMLPNRSRVSNVGDIRGAGGILAGMTFGEQTVLNQAVLINLGALAMLMNRLVVHRLSAGATRTVHETDLHTLPGEPPILLRRPWIVESRRPDREALFGRTASLAGYPLDDSIFLIGLDWPDGAFVSRWRPDWTEKDLDATVEPDQASPLIGDVDSHHAWARQAARFAVVLGLLLEAEGSPVTVEEEQPKGRTRGGTTGAGRMEDEWITRRVYINERKFLASSVPGPHRQGTDRPADAVEATVLVRGHMKRQPYGPGRQLRKWIYVQSYEARRWVSPRPVRVDVGVRE